MQQQSFPITEARIITGALTPTGPSHPKRSIVLLLSLLLGGAAGAAIGAVRELRDRTYRTEDQIRQARAQLESTVQHLEFPIIPVLKGVLVLPLIGTPDRARLAEAGMRLSEAITRERATVAIIDITGLLAMDTGVARELLRIAQVVTLLGCQPMLVGIAPAAAEELVQLGFRTDRLATQSTLQQAVALALRMRTPQNSLSLQPHA